MTKARYIIETIENGNSTKSRAKEILSRFDEFELKDKEAQNEIFTAITDWIKKQNLKIVKVEKYNARSVIVYADKATRRGIDSALHKLYNLGYTVKTQDNFSTYQLR